MNRDQIIEIEKRTAAACVAAETACWEAQKVMAEAGVSTDLAAYTFFLTGLNHVEDLRAETQLEMIGRCARFIAERCQALESKGVDVSD